MINSIDSQDNKAYDLLDLKTQFLSQTEGTQVVEEQCDFEDFDYQKSYRFIRNWIMNYSSEILVPKSEELFDYDPFEELWDQEGEYEDESEENDFDDFGFQQEYDINSTTKGIVIEEYD